MARVIMGYYMHLIQVALWLAIVMQIKLGALKTRKVLLEVASLQATT